MAAGATPKQRRPGGRALRVTQAVHRAVLDAVAEVGVDNVSIPDVSRRAGVQDSTVYRRWGTRDNLLLDVLLAVSERTLPLPDTGTLRGDLAALATELIAYLRTPLGQGLTRALPLVPEPGVAQRRERFWTERFRRTGEIVDRAVARGEIPPSTDARMAIEVLIAPIHFRNMLTGEHLDAELADQLADFVTRALQPSMRRAQHPES